ncbi:MAG: homoserine dehydrogenase [Trueperaceae bacterium]
MAAPPGRSRVAILGAGNVGRALIARIDELRANGQDDASVRLASPRSVPMGSESVSNESVSSGSVADGYLAGASVAGVLVKNLVSPRSPSVARQLLTADGPGLIDQADVVVELLGGVEPAATLMLQALRAGKRVVSANKAALAERWDEFVPYLREGTLYFEAAVMAGTPIIGSLAGALRGCRPLELHAVLNGTTTFILSRLEAGEEFGPALAEAQRLGYAEADPALDIGGFDAAHKLALIGRLAFDPQLSWKELAAHTHGISHLTPAIVREAMEDGGSVRLVGSIYPGEAAWRARVRTVYLPAGHPLTATAESGNALLLRARDLGEVLVQGPGAGGEATAAAVLADLLQALAGRPGPAPLPLAAPLPKEYRVEDLGELIKA